MSSKVRLALEQTPVENAVGPPGGTEKMIPLVRKTFGDNVALYADANGFYSVPEATRAGRLLEEYRFRYFEEPVMFANGKIKVPAGPGFGVDFDPEWIAKHQPVRD